MRRIPDFVRKTSLVNSTCLELTVNTRTEAHVCKEYAALLALVVYCFDIQNERLFAANWIKDKTDHRRALRVVVSRSRAITLKNLSDLVRLAAHFRKLHCENAEREITSNVSTPIAAVLCLLMLLTMYSALDGCVESALLVKGSWLRRTS